MRRFGIFAAICVLTLSACVTLGGFGANVDQVEGDLVQQLITETCPVRRTIHGKKVTTSVSALSTIGIKHIYPNRHDEGRTATIVFEGEDFKFGYNPVTGMTVCAEPTPEHDGFMRYDFVSQTLVNHGGKPQIYDERQLAHQENREPAAFAQLPKRLYLTVRAIYFDWDGYSTPVPGTLSLMEDGITEQLTAALPNSNSYCVGYTTHRGGDFPWRLKCTNGLNASGKMDFGIAIFDDIGNGKDNDHRYIDIFWDDTRFDDPQLAEQARVALAHARHGVTDETRNLTVNWEGYEDLLIGTVREIGDGRKGTVTIILPNMSEECVGTTRVDPYGRGHWFVNCPDDMHALGDFTPLGRGKGVVGKGADSLGRSITFKVAPMK